MASFVIFCLMDKTENCEPEQLGGLDWFLDVMVFKGGYLSTPVSLCLSVFPPLILHITPFFLLLLVLPLLYIFTQVIHSVEK